ncbi:hypothetical protein [Antarcticirhabdus aurantiaca]|uniref:Uncharacterized protein n=1 Tax=Antarcticirhabdus aurantiaca TaxID=2606717 RepID=A0ACD4NQQ4_9HYPH|nr:hypothetical protein [Antarcticirhabdus aurantiaca]WAJ29082.1 hypothetical protein OXU80_02220 [Jeongeuplla avenae]
MQTRTRFLVPAMIAAALALGACDGSGSGSAGNAGNSAGSGDGPTNGAGSANSPDQSSAGTPPAN